MPHLQHAVGHNITPRHGMGSQNPYLCRSDPTTNDRPAAISRSRRSWIVLFSSSRRPPRSLREAIDVTPRTIAFAITIAAVTTSVQPHRPAAAPPARHTQLHCQPRAMHVLALWLAAATAEGKQPQRPSSKRHSSRQTRLKSNQTSYKYCPKHTSQALLLPSKPASRSTTRRGQAAAPDTPSHPATQPAANPLPTPKGAAHNCLRSPQRAPLHPPNVQALPDS